jgi:LysR family hydrogen peroxide-inducible transcriptional activator
MELHQLRYVLAVARTSSFTRAAEELFLAQPSLSVQIRKLEDELHVDLFHRLGHGVELTAAGEAFCEQIEPALARLEQARAQALAVRNMERGQLAIGVLPSVGATILPSVLSDYRDAYPNIEIRLTEHNVSARLEHMVQSGRLDLAVIRGPGNRSGVTGRLLIREPLLAMLVPGHRLACRDELRLEELAGEDFIGMQSGYGLRELMDAICQRHGFSPRVAVETSQLSVLCGMVGSGLGVSVLPRLAASGYSPTVALRDPQAVRELSVIWRHRVCLSPTADAFLELLAAATAAESGAKL